MRSTGDPILLVEDDGDQLFLLSELLRWEGYDVVPARDAQEGYAALRAKRFAAVLCDHWLPRKSGGLMLAEAKAAGLLEGTGVLVLTGTPERTELRGVRVLAKPIVPEVLLAELRSTLRSVEQPARERKHDARAELVLYVHRGSPTSQQARRNLESVLGEQGATRVKLEIVDISVPDARVDPDDRVVLVPTLVKRAPGARARLLGLRDLDAIRRFVVEASELANSSS